MKNNGIDSGGIARILSSTTSPFQIGMQGLAHCLNPYQMRAETGSACDWNRSFPRNLGVPFFEKMVFLIGT